MCRVRVAAYVQIRLLFDVEDDPDLSAVGKRCVRPAAAPASRRLLSVICCVLPPFGEHYCCCSDAIWLLGVSVCRLSASNTAAVSKACQSAAFGEQYCRCSCYLACQSAAFWRAILPLFLLSGVSVCRLSASNTAADSAIWRVSLQPFEQYCRCSCCLACQSAAFRRAKLPLMRKACQSFGRQS